MLVFALNIQVFTAAREKFDFFDFFLHGIMIQYRTAPHTAKICFNLSWYYMICDDNSFLL